MIVFSKVNHVSHVTQLHSVVDSIFPFKDTTRCIGLITPETGPGWIPLSWIVTLKPEYNKIKIKEKGAVEGGKTPS